VTAVPSSTAIDNISPETLQPEYQYPPSWRGHYGVAGVWSVRYIDAAVLRDENTDADDLCDDERLYYLNDANMNVTCLVDASGDAVERYVYDPYGRVTFLDGSGNLQENGDVDGIASDYDNEILYCGYRYDAETGFYHVRHRYLHPTAGRWVSRDSAGYVDGMSVYEGVRGRPTSLVDPFGAATDESFAGLGTKISDYVKKYIDSRQVWPTVTIWESKDGRKLQFYGSGTPVEGCPESCQCWDVALGLAYSWEKWKDVPIPWEVWQKLAPAMKYLKPFNPTVPQYIQKVIDDPVGALEGAGRAIDNFLRGGTGTDVYVGTPTTVAVLNPQYTAQLNTYNAARNLAIQDATIAWRTEVAELISGREALLSATNLKQKKAGERYVSLTGNGRICHVGDEWLWSVCEFDGQIGLTFGSTRKRTSGHRIDLRGKLYGNATWNACEGGLAINLAAEISATLEIGPVGLELPLVKIESPVPILKIDPPALKAWDKEPNMPQCDGE